jgi:protein-S-isoprenylcysteine O-methyltransferase Ste14
MSATKSSRLAADRAEKLVLAGLYAWLAYRLLPQLADHPLNAVYLASEAMIILLVMFRRSASDISHRSADWVVGFAGTFLTLMVVQADGAVVPYGGVLMLVGFGISVSAQLSLRRSFGVVAANRGVRTGGPYGWVRHPMYLGYFLTQLGFLLANPAPWNLALCVVWTACQIYRVHAEERVLSGDTAYAAFAQRVRYRLVPGVY